MASFSTAYNKYIKPNEGGYSNVTGDKGGETYGGVARNLWPSWIGWPQIDAKKKNFTSGVIPRNTIFKDLDDETEAFYQNWWNKGYFNQIANQDVANLLFDYNVNSGGTAIKAVQKLVGATADGAMGPNTVAAINKADSVKLYNDLLENRKGLYATIVKRDPTQQQFWNGWMNRLANFPALVTPANTLVVLAVIGLVVWGIFQYSGSSNRKPGMAGFDDPVW